MQPGAIGFLAAAAALSLSGCQSIQQASASTADIAVKSGKAAGSAMGDTYQGLGEAATTPLHDLNLMKSQLPAILIHAYAHPYDRAGMDTCPAIADEIHQLDLALGPDVDVPEAPMQGRDAFEKNASVAADAALDAVRSATGGVIPVRAWVRRLSGAVRAEQEAKAVALAGSVRRGYLKALGERKACDWPASPLSPQVYRAKLAPMAADATAAPPPAPAASLSP